MDSLDLTGEPNVSAATPSGTVLLDVTATSTNPQTARNVANATAKSLAEEIVRLETTASGAKPVQVEVIRPATVPGSPVSPRTTTSVLIGAFLGLLAGATIALLRRLLDTTVKSQSEVEQATGATSLGAVAFDPDARKSPLVTMRGGSRAEAFRTIRTNLRYIDVDNPPRSVVITSSVPKEGKTTTACNLAIALAQAGSRVLLLEADLRRPKVAEYLGVDGSVGLTDVLIGQIPLNDVVVSWQRGLLDFLPSGAIPPNPSELLGSRQMADLLGELVGRYDVVVLDAPPLLPVSDAAVLATVADGALVVCRHGETHRDQVEKAADALRQVDARILGTILNFAPTRRGGYGYSSGGHGYADYSYDAKDARASGRRLLSADEVPAPEPRV
jgi:capsular exopolysaccharide synthesis family protein